ncbi:MAG: DNA-directed polymerase subunit [Methanothermococcus sp.]|jgi:DNA-directed RNA polymerase subunit A"|uniref:DNA-directed RNA polymerase subunit A'' n=1 Tax=Methanothermococcus sp. TaxID=2614238 RepID=UPI0031845459|nr:DNA-directed polymerase subunit [Methanothermococcus sp.]
MEKMVEIEKKLDGTILPPSLKEELAKKIVSENIEDENIIDEIIKETIVAYERTLVEPGEAVGVIAAQSIGEPGTQMSLPYEEEIIIKDGELIKPIKIGALVDECIEKYGYININDSEVCDLPIDLYVPSLDQDEKIHWKRIISCIRHENPKKLIKIKTKSGRSITATPYHSFVIRENNKVVPVKGSDLKVGDRIPTVKHIPANCIDAISIGEYVADCGRYTIDENNNTIAPKINGKPIINNIDLDYDFGYFIGVYLAEGHSTKYFVSISNVDEEVLEKIRKFAEKLNLSYNEYDNNSGFAKSHDIRINSSVLAEFMNKFGAHSKEKKVADFVYGAKKEFVKGVVRGYFDGDGNVNPERKMIRAYSSSKRLIDDMALLLSRFGIFSVKTTMKEQYGLIIPHRYAKAYYNEIGFTVPKKAEKLKELVESLNDENTYDSIDMIPSIGDAFYVLSDKVGYPSVYAKKFTNKQKIGRGALQKHITKMEEIAKEKNIDITEIKEYYLLKKAIDSDVIWDEIVSIEEIIYENKYVYDISVEGLETFTTYDGILTHNTMRTFHYAGVAELNVTLGLPRMIEIVDARKEPSTPTMTIFLEDEYKYDREKAEEIARNIESTTVESVSDDISVNLVDECITIILDKDELAKRGITVDHVVESIKKKMKLKIEVDGYTLQLKIKTPSLKALRKRLPKIRSIHLTGVPNISRVIIRKEVDEYVLYSEGSNLKEVFTIEGVDKTRTITNNIIEIQEVLGIEAARNAIINEMNATLSNQGLTVDIRHLMLVADLMTADGEVKPIGRHGISGGKASVLARAAFEETVKHLYAASMRGYNDELKGVVENIIVGKPISLGTGCIELYVDSDYEEGKNIKTE